MNDQGSNIVAFQKLPETEQQAILKAIYYKVKNKDQFIAFSWNPDQVQGAIEFLMTKGIIEFPDGKKVLHNAVLADSYLINGNDAL